MGFLDIEREKLIEGVDQSKKLMKSEEGKLIQKTILESSNINLNYNMLTLELNQK